jgi:outer membrane protein insertion porin family
MPRFLLALACALVACVRGASAAPIEEVMGRRIASVRIEVEGTASEDPTLVDLVETRPGEPLDAREVRESIAHLFGLARFEDVRVDATEVEGGLALRYELIPVHSVQRIAFEGNAGLGAGTLRRAVSERFGLSPAAARRDEVVRFLEQLYADNGYLHAAITPRTHIEHQPERVTLIFQIEAGPRLRISAVSPEGNAVPSLEAAVHRIGLRAGEFYDRRKVRSRINEYLADVRERGYYEARGEHKLVPTADGLSGTLVLTLDTGPHITLVFEGDPVPSRVRDELVTVEREGSIDEDLLEDTAHGLEEYLRSQGYRDADVTYTRAPRDGELAVVFRVSRGLQYQVARVAVTGNASVPMAPLAPSMRVQPNTPFVEDTLDADVAVVQELYRSQGFGSAQVKEEVSEDRAARPVAVTVTLHVTEGPRTLIESVSLAGNRAFPEGELRKGLVSQPEKPFYEPQLGRDREALASHYQNAGYRAVTVTPAVTYNADRTRARVRFDIGEGPQVFVEHVIIVGNEKTSRETIRREITLNPGDPLGFDALSESRRRISALGLFRRVDIRELAHGAQNRRDLLVSVEEAPATTLGYGGGLELSRRLVRPPGAAAPDERIEVAPRGFFEIGRRNLFGRNRSVNLFTRLSLRLRQDPTVSEDGQEPATDFNEYRVFGTYRQPRFFMGTDLLASGFLEQGARTSFDFNRRGARAEIGRRFSRKMSMSARYAIERTEVFNRRFDAGDGETREDERLIDRIFPQVRLSTVSSAVIRDSRDDPIGPTSGSLFGIDTEVAGRTIGSEVGFVKSFVQAFRYRRVPGRRGVVFAAGARLGLAAGFARTVTRIGHDGNPIVEVVDDLPASERFFAGGDTTVRGFSLDQLGTPATLDENGFPLGGNAVVILNAELRLPVWRDLGAVTFVDAGNVFARVPDLAFGDLRATAGFGLRYRSPIGPLRVDLGFKLDPRALPGGQQEKRTALHISLGQAF